MVHRFLYKLQSVCTGFIMETPLFHVSSSNRFENSALASVGKYPPVSGAYAVRPAAVCSSSRLSLSQSFAGNAWGKIPLCSVDNIIILEFSDFVKCFSADSTIALISKWKNLFSYQKKEKNGFFWKNHIRDSVGCRHRRRIHQKGKKICFRRKNSRLPLTNRWNHGIVI